MPFLKTAKTFFEALPAVVAFTAACLFASPGPAIAREVTDSTGTVVSVQERPSRIVTLAPSLGELAAELSGNQLERIAGVSEYTDYPPALSKKPSIGSYARFNLERVVALKPDLVLATEDGNPREQVLQLRELKVPVVVVSTETLAQVEQSVRLVARAMGEEERGRKLAERLVQGLDRIRARAKKRPARKVLLQLGDDPLVVVGKKSFLNEALETVGARNAYGDLSARYPRPSLEDALARDPDVILILELGAERGYFKEISKRWERFPSLKAVRGKQVRVLRADPLLRPGLRLLEGLELLEKAVYGEK